METFDKKEIEDNYQQYISRKKRFKDLGVDYISLGDNIVKYIDSSVSNILEIGTGKGSLTLLLAERSKNIISIDINEEVQYKAKLLLAYKNLTGNVSFKVENAQDLLYKDKSFDLVISAFSFHHFQMPFAIIDQMARLSQKQVIITEFNEQGFAMVEQMHKKENSVHHRANKNFDDVKEPLLEHGFKVRAYDGPWYKTYVGVKEKGENDTFNC